MAFYGYILVHLHIDIRIRTYVLYSYLFYYTYYTWTMQSLPHGSWGAMRSTRRLKTA